MIKRIKHKGEVKEYSSRAGTEKKFFVTFDDGLKSMFPASAFDSINEGDVIEFEGVFSKGWINVDRKNFEIKIIQSTTPTSTTPQATATVSTTTVEPHKDEAQVEVNYLTHPRPNKRNQLYTMAKFLKGQAVENLYIPLSAIGNDIRETVLAGYGTIRVEGNLNKDTFFVSKVLSFEPTIRQEVTEVELKDVRFGLYHLSIIDKDGRRITIPHNKVPFPFSPVFETIKSEFSGLIKINGGFRKVGKVKKNKKTGEWEEEVSWIDNDELTFDFTGIDTDKIKKVEAKHQQDLEYAKLLAMLKHNPAFRSFTGIKKMFTDKGLNITTQQIEELFWDEKYDKEFYNTLKRKCSEIYVSEEEFIFVMIVEGLQFYIVEKPIANSATYIFNNSCDKDLLLDRLHATRKFDIIRNSLTVDGRSLQEALGYKGRVVHQDHDGWLQKIQLCIGDGIEKMLEDKFIW